MDAAVVSQAPGTDQPFLEAIAWWSLKVDAIHSLGAGLLGAIALLLVLRVMDWTMRSNGRASAHLKIMETHALALGVYKGLRLLGCALIMAAAVLASK